MNADTDSHDLGGIQNLEGPRFVQNSDYGISVMSALSSCDLVPVVNLDDPTGRKLNRESLKRIDRLERER